MKIKMYHNDWDNPYHSAAISQCKSHREFDIEDDDFCETVMTRPHVYAKFDGNKRKDTFVESYGIIMDFDTKTSDSGNVHKDSSIKEFLSSTIAKKTNWILYTSKSHHRNGNGDCFHVVFLFDSIIDTIQLHDAIHKFIKAWMVSDGLSFDQTPSSITGANPSIPENENVKQPIFDLYSEDSNKSIDILYNQAFTESVVFFPKTLSSYLINNNNYLETGNGKKNNTSNLESNKCEEESVGGLPTFYNSRIGRTFQLLDNDYKYSLVEWVCLEINRINRSSHYQDLSMQDWVMMGTCIKAIFKDEGYALFYSLSHGHPLDTDESLRNRYDSFDENRSKFSHFMKTLKDFDISFVKQLHLWFHTQERNNVVRTKIVKEIGETIVNDIETEVGMKVVDVSWHRVSSSSDARSLGYSFVMEDGSVEHRVYDKKHRKECYRRDEDIMSEVVVRKVVHDQENKKAVSIVDRVYDEISNSVLSRYEDNGYITKKHITEITKETISQYGFKKRYKEEYFATKHIIKYLVKNNILTGDSKYTRIEGRQLKVYLFVENEQEDTSIEP